MLNMVVGSGMLATRFVKYLDCHKFLIFASGVSNSKETRLSEFQREFELLKETILSYPELHLVYFSTCSMYDPDEKYSDYVLHKIKLEIYIKKHVRSYSIFRISQIIAIAKNQTLINFLINNIKSQIKFNVWKMATRNLVAIDDVFAIIDYMLQYKVAYNKIIHVANDLNISIFNLIAIVERCIGIKANIVVLDKGKPYDKIPIDDISECLDALNVRFDDEYYERTIKSLLTEGRVALC